MLRRQAQQGRLLQTGVTQPGVPQANPLNTLQQTQQVANQRIGTRFEMKQRMFAIGDDFFIKNENGDKVIRVNGKLLRLKQQLSFEDMQGHEIYHIAAKMVDIRETMDIKRPDGSKAAIVHDAWFSPIKDKWQINVPGGQDLTAKGNILQHEYTITDKGGRLPIAIISKKWIRLRDTYGVELQSAFDAPLVLAITVAIDMMSHNHMDNQTMGGISKGSRLDIL